MECEGASGAHLSFKSFAPMDGVLIESTGFKLVECVLCVSLQRALDLAPGFAQRNAREEFRSADILKLRSPEMNSEATGAVINLF